MNPQQQNQFSTSLSLANFSTEHMPLAARRQIHKDSCDIFRAVVHKNMLENGMSLVTNTAMTNIANLSLLESQLSAIAPTAENRLRFIVDHYTIKANNRLGGY